MENKGEEEEYNFGEEKKKETRHKYIYKHIVDNVHMFNMKLQFELQIEIEQPATAPKETMTTTSSQFYRINFLWTFLPQ